MQVINKPKDIGKLYIKSYYKTLGENPEQFNSTVKKTDYGGRNVIYRQAYSQCPFLYSIYFIVILNTKQK